MPIKTYSLAKDGNTKLSNNFTVREFRCKDGSDAILIDTKLISILQKIRDYFNATVTINSAYRNATYNKKIGGASNSQHTKGTAADIVVNGVNPLKVAQYGEYLGAGGIGYYNIFTHIDVRSGKSRWDQTSGKPVAVSTFGQQDQFKGMKDLTEEQIRKMIKEEIDEVLKGADTPSKWAAEEWQTAKEKGITDGTRPTGVLTREQGASMVVRALTK